MNKRQADELRKRTAEGDASLRGELLELLGRPVRTEPHACANGCGLILRPSIALSLDDAEAIAAALGTIRSTIDRSLAKLETIKRNAAT